MSGLYLGGMLLTVLSLCLSVQLTPHEISNAEIDALNVSQLEYEDWRLSDRPSYAGWATMLGLGVPVAAGGTVLSYLAIDATSRAFGWSLVAWWIVDVFAVAVTVVGYGLAIAGGVMLPITSWRRGKFAARQGEVRARLAAIESGQVDAPYEPDLEAARWELAVTKLQTRRPGLGLPLGLMGGGLGLGLYGAYTLVSTQQSAASGADTTFSVGLAIAYLAAGFVMEGVGTCFLISRVQERAEIDRELAELNAAPPSRMPPPPPPPASKLPSAPVFFGYSWEL